jgi:hypothetical protein
MKRHHFAAVAAMIVAAVAVGYATIAPAPASSTTGPAYIAWGYNGDGTYSVLRSSGITDTYESTVAGGGYECIDMDAPPLFVTTGDGSMAIISGDLANLGWDAQDAWFGSEGGYCPGAQVMMILSGNADVYAHLQ